MIVVDTNVVAYLVIRNEYSPLADLVLQKEATWAAPKLWRSELRNVLTLNVWKKFLTMEIAVEAMFHAEAVMGEYEYDIESSRVLELAAMSQRTAYDCEFVALAENLNVPLVTSDKKLLAAFPIITVSMEAFIV